MTVPGRYRSPVVLRVAFAEKVAAARARAARLHACTRPSRCESAATATYALDIDGSSAWGYHSMNCTPSAMQGAIWVQFTQTLICNDKVNDGAYLAVQTNFPAGRSPTSATHEGSTGIAWALLQPNFHRLSAHALARAPVARLHRGGDRRLRELGNVIQGGGKDQYGNSSAIMNFEIAVPGHRREVHARRPDYCAAMFNPEGDMGDVENWELISPFVYLARQAQGIDGRPGPPPRWRRASSRCW